MPKIEKILGYFPAHYYASDRKKLIYHVASILANKLLEDENAMVGVLKAHWINTLEDVADLKRFATLYSDLGEPYDDGVDKGRERLKKIVRLYLAGPGTVRSIFEFSELALARHGLSFQRNGAGEIVLRDENGKILFDEVSQQNFITRAEIKSATAAFEVELEENPELDKFFEQPEALNRVAFTLINRGFFSQYPKISVTGVGQRTANFMIVNAGSGQAIGFRGSVPAGKTLVLIPDENGIIQQAVLDGLDVIGQVYSLAGGQFEKDNYDEAGQALIAERRPLHAYDNAVFAGPEDVAPVYFQPPFAIRGPEIPVAKSDWWLHVFPARFDETRFDAGVYRIPEILGTSYDAGRFDEAIFAVEASARLRFDWQERERASFVLRLPAEPFGTVEQSNQALESTKKITQRIKAAGVKAEVKFKTDLFTIDRSILRDSAATAGPGIDSLQARI